MDETAVWPIFFLLNVFIAHKGSKLFYSYLQSLQLLLCRVGTVKYLHAPIYNPDYILLLVL